MTKTTLATGTAVLALFCAPAMAQEPGGADASCSAQALAAVAGPALVIQGAERGENGLCTVTGTVTTDGDGVASGSARFALRLPAEWNGRFLFLGGSGFNGFVPEAPPELLAAGYAALSTDTGHEGKPGGFPGVDATWAVAAPGERDEVAFADYAWRSRRQVDEAVRPLVPAYYGTAIDHSYFVGCSNGGREALQMAQDAPDAFDGFVAGSPFVGLDHVTLFAHNARALLADPIPYSAFPAIDAAVLGQCDGVDGVRDGLVQNPAMCAFDPAALVADGTLTRGQAAALTAYLSAPRDTDGRQIGYANTASGLGNLFPPPPGLPGGLTGLSATITDGVAPAREGFPFGPMPGGPINWQLGTGGIGYLAYADLSMGLLDPRISRADGALEPDMVARVRERLASMMPTPEGMADFFRSDAKLIVYHGFDDPILNPYTVMDFYRRAAELNGGVEAAQDRARLFMAPNMAHCSLGTGPNTFDPLAAIEAWAERGQAPDAIVAAHYPGRPGEGAPDRTMPLCPYPQVARYDGTGDVNAAASWSCAAGAGDLTQGGPDGTRAGWTAGESR